MLHCRTIASTPPCSKSLSRVCAHSQCDVAFTSSCVQTLFLSISCAHICSGCCPFGVGASSFSICWLIMVIIPSRMFCWCPCQPLFTSRSKMCGEQQERSSSLSLVPCSLYDQDLASFIPTEARGRKHGSVITGSLCHAYAQLLLPNYLHFFCRVESQSFLRHLWLRRTRTYILECQLINSVFSSLFGSVSHPVGCALMVHFSHVVGCVDS
jgi:hypothetical protein